MSTTFDHQVTTLEFAGYERISDARNAMTGERDTRGTDRQHADVVAIEARTPDVQIVQWFSDPDASAFRKGAKRPGFDAMLDAFDRGDIRGVVVWRVDRLARAFREWQRILIRVHDEGMIVRDATGMDYSTPEGKRMLDMLATQARAESENTSARGRRAHLDKRLRGLPHPNRHRPFGHSIDWMQIVPEEADAVNQAAASLLAGDTIYSILAEWSRRGITATTGKPWNGHTFTELMTQARIAGGRDVTDDDGRVIRVAITGAFPPVLDGDPDGDDSPLSRLVALRAILSRPPQKGRPSAPTRLLDSSLLRCAHCGEKIGSHSTNGAPGYACLRPNFQNSHRRGCGKVVVSQKAVDGFVRDAIFARFDGLKADRAVTTNATPTAVRLAEIADQQDQLAKAYAAKQITLSMMIAGSGDLEREREHLLATQNPRRLPKMTGDVRSEWDAADHGWRRAIVQATVRRVTIASAEGRNNVPISARVRVEFFATDGEVEQ